MSASGAVEARFPLAALHQFCCRALEAAGVPAEAATIVADSLTQGDARGLASHGVVRLLPVYISRLRVGSTQARPQIRVINQRGSAALMDGGGGLGQVVGHQAMELALQLAEENGAGVVGVRNSSHFGTGAFFLEQAVRAGKIGLVMTNAPSNMPPHGGRKPYFGTNPLGVGIPCGSEPPIILDMSTSVVAQGKIIMAQINGQQEIPEGWAIDREGYPTRSPEAALQGAVLPMAGYKGSGLALVIEALCGVLTGAAFGPHIVRLYDQGPEAQNLGHFFGALDVEVFMPGAEFQARMMQFVQEIRSQPRQPNVERIFLPGEIEAEKVEESRRLGVTISAAGQQELDRLAETLDIPTLGSIVK